MASHNDYAGTGRGQDQATAGPGVSADELLRDHAAPRNTQHIDLYIAEVIQQLLGEIGHIRGEVGEARGCRVTDAGNVEGNDAHGSSTATSGVNNSMLQPMPLKRIIGGSPLRAARTPTRKGWRPIVRVLTSTPTVSLVTKFSVLIRTIAVLLAPTFYLLTSAAHQVVGRR